MLRDGDWMPWPWTTASHQSDETYLEIRPHNGEAVASIPIEEGAAVWQGILPEGFLAFLPAKQAYAGGITLAMSRLVGQQHLEQARLFANSVQILAQTFNIPVPRYIVVVPYLNNLIWNGDFVLVIAAESISSVLSSGFIGRM